MKTKPIVLTAFAVFALSACNQGDGNSEEVAQLRQEVTELRQSTQDTRLKLQLAGHVWGRSPLGDFFAAPEFWENTYDSSGADCARRCQSANAPLRAACAARPESEHQQCYTDAANSLGLCVQRCS